MLMLCIDYRLGFNTIVPAKLIPKLLFNCNWILDFLMGTPQVMKIGNNICSTVILDTGAPQGCCFSPRLYSLFTYDCTATYNSYHSSTTMHDRDALQRVVATAQRITGCDLPSIGEIHTICCLNKAQSIIQDPNHPGHRLFFRVNEFGVLEVINDETEVESVKKAHATTTWAVPTAQEGKTFSESRTNIKEERPVTRGNLRCAHCHQIGSPQDSHPDGKFCSEKCLQQAQENEHRPKKDTKPNAELHSTNRKRKIQLPGNLKAENTEDGDDPREEEDDSEDRADRKVVRGPQRSRRKRRGDAALLKQAVPYGGKKKSWSWASYLEQEKAIAAPSKLFKEHQSFPHSKNGFKVGMKLEGVDPEHPSVYCVLTVAEVSGYRIRLHFDKYSDCYDFWINANSSDIHPVGWCEKTGHKLYPPKGMKEEEFSWQAYIKLCKAQAAPKALFENQNTTVTPSGFRIGMKLEAVDRKNPTFICVATVTDMVDSRFLVHFDNWDESYDYCFASWSIAIYCVYKCKNAKRFYYPNAKHFSWERYLEETNSLPAPARAFKSRPTHGFHRNMKLEAVDKRNPMLIRVVTIVDTDDHRIKIHFDGWGDEYDYWVDTDSPDIHPAGWCAKTIHPLQPPISPQDMFESSEQGGCPTPGCKGVGHIKGARYSGHHSAVGCPYSDININKDSVLPDRLSGEIPVSSLSMAKNRKGESNCDTASSVVEKQFGSNQNNHSKTCGTETLGAQEANEDSLHKKPPVHHRTHTLEPESPRVGRPCKQRKVEEELEEEEIESEESSITETKVDVCPEGVDKREFVYNYKNAVCLQKYIKIGHSCGKSEELTLQQALHQSVFMSSTSPIPSLPLCWEQHSKLLPSVAGITASKVAGWTVEEVTEFIQGLPGCKEQVKTFREEQIDGEAFLLLTQVDLVKILSIKLGPALKIYNSILMFKTAENSYNEL
ncbi:LMBL3 protein, partial [Atractosteus spatula]|nr:LMBL3 protein [Atractosteus spatula]